MFICLLILNACFQTLALTHFILSSALALPEIIRLLPSAGFCHLSPLYPHCIVYRNKQ